MCGPSKQERRLAIQAQEEQAQAAAEQQLAADQALREEAERRAQIKQGDILDAISASTVRRGTSGGAGRRSLFSSSAAGFLSRFQ
jgi:hypothetical protein